MADLKRFSDIETVGIPSTPIQRFATDQSGATRKQAGAQVAGALLEAGGQAFQAVDTAITQRKLRDLVGESGELPGMMKPSDELTAEEASFLNFSQIAEARSRGLSAERAQIAASTRLQQAIARDPRRAGQFKQAFSQFFGGTSTFDMTAAEEAVQDTIDFGQSKFGLDPRLAYSNPQEWERQFQTEMVLWNQQREVERAVNISDAQVTLSQNEQQIAAPTFISSTLTNPESQMYIPGAIDGVLAQYTTEAGDIDISKAANIQQELQVQREAVMAALKDKFSALTPGQFDNTVQPIKDYYDTAIAVGNGEMELSALQRENKIFRESATKSIYNGSPKAAQQWVGITSLIGDMEVVPPEIVMRQAELAKMLLPAMPTLLDPEGTTSAGSFLDESGMEDFNSMSQMGLDAAQRAAPLADGPTKGRIANTLTLVANEISNNPTGVKAGTYAKYFSSLLNDSVVDTLSPEQTERIQQSLGSEAMQDYLGQTLERWVSNAPQYSKIIYNPDMNRVEILVDQGASGLTRKRAREATARMRQSNLYFAALDKFLGVNGEDVLASNELGRGILATSGIEVQQEGEVAEGFEGIDARRERRRAVSEIAGSIISGDASDEDISLFRSLLDEEPGLRDNPFPKLQDALDVLNSQGELTEEEMNVEPTSEQIVPEVDILRSGRLRSTITDMLTEGGMSEADIANFLEGTGDETINNKAKEILNAA